MKIFTIFPLLTVPVLIYNFMAWSGAAFTSAEAVRERLNEDFLFLPMTSGAEWTITPGHALICVGLLTLFFELLKATGIGRAAIINHAFSMVLFIICLIEFLMLSAFATSVFFFDVPFGCYGWIYCHLSGGAARYRRCRDGRLSRERDRNRL